MQGILCWRCLTLTVPIQICADAIDMSSISASYWWWVLCRLFFHLLVVFFFVLLEDHVSLALSWGVGVRVVEQLLNAQQHLLHRDGRPPLLIFVQNAKAYGAGRIDVGMEEPSRKLALHIGIKGREAARHNRMSKVQWAMCCTASTSRRPCIHKFQIGLFLHLILRIEPNLTFGGLAG